MISKNLHVYFVLWNLLDQETFRKLEEMLLFAYLVMAYKKGHEC